MIRKIFSILCILLGTYSSNLVYASTIQPAELLDIITDSKEKKVVLINFYASWCPPCVEEIPSLVRLRKRYSEDKLKIIGINLDKSADIMEEFNKKMGINYLTFYDTGAIQNLYKITAIPFIAIYGKNGNIIYAEAGYAQEEILIKSIEYGLK